VLALALVSGNLVAQGHFEHKTDDPAPPVRQLEGPRGVAAQNVVSFGAFTSVQTNVDGAGNNRLNDAANEPTIVVDPNNPQNIVIGWRQFDNIASNFRENGYAYSNDGGATWTNPGAIVEGTFYSDPVLGADSSGNIYYLSYPGGSTMTLFRSTDSGQTWPTQTFLTGGDKAWMSVDRSGGVGDGHIYMVWQVASGPRTFSRSVNGGASFETPISIPGVPTFGTTVVDQNGNVFCAGLNQQFFGSYILAKSSDAQNSGQTPTFTTVNVNLGGSMDLGNGPNPGGLLGQAQVLVDPTNANRVYYLGSVNPPGGDPMDVHIAVSTDGGNTFGSPIRINDDSGNSAWQWFGTMGVAPNGRIDTVWNDTRGNPTATSTSVTYYSYSTDAGSTWSKNVPIGPSWQSAIGFPSQNKIGDYYDMESDNAAGNLAYSATYNGEQDVYYVRLGDCNNNQVHDGTDIANGTSSDANGNTIPDECETCQPSLGFGSGVTTFSVCGDDLTMTGALATMDLTGAPAGTSVVVFLGTSLLATPMLLPDGGQFTIDFNAPPALAVPGFVINANGRLALTVNGGSNNVGTLYAQAVSLFGPFGISTSNTVQIQAGS